MISFLHVPARGAPGGRAVARRELAMHRGID
jgi:hypothetical protein